jgi:hypothetical protein
MKPIIQFHRDLIPLVVKSTALILALASAQIATAQLHNTKTGVNAGASITTGDENTSDGFSALQLTNTGSFNTAVGSLALQKNTTGINNTAVGYQALTLNIGAGNTAIGSQALSKNTTGHNNTASGTMALLNNTVGAFNTVEGDLAMQFNTKGNFNVASGYRALFRNTTGSDNTAEGYQALFSNTTAAKNTAVGSGALTSNTTAIENTAVGAGALTSNTTGADCTAIGAFALSNSTGNYNTALGANAGTDPGIGTNNIYIGDPGFPGDTNVISIGGIAASGTAYTSCFIGGIYGASVNSGTALPVYVDTDGHLGTANVSSARFKDDIKPMDRASESILALQPVTFRYKPEFDAAQVPQFGLVAEEVEKVNASLVVRDRKGKPYGVRYDQVNAMLLNEFLKEHKKVEELQITVAQQEKGMEVLTAQLKEQAAQIQKVSAQVKVSQPAPQVVANKP